MRTTIARSSPRCQSLAAGVGVTRPERPRARLRPKVKEFCSVCHIRATLIAARGWVACGRRRATASGVRRYRLPGSSPAQAPLPIQAAKEARFGAPSAAATSAAALASSVLPPAWATPRPQTSQRSTASASRHGSATHGKSGFVHAGQGGFSGPAALLSGTTGGSVGSYAHVRLPLSRVGGDRPRPPRRYL